MSITEQRTDQTAVVTAASIAEPIRVGVDQGGEDYGLLVPGHVLVMGMTGSGKSTSRWCNDLGDVLTPEDAAAIDHTGEGGRA